MFLIFEFLQQMCSRTLEQFKEVMETGVPELGLPPLDPITLDVIDFKFFNMTHQSLDVALRGERWTCCQDNSRGDIKRNILINTVPTIKTCNYTKL